jgi:dUTP pyrophosphatase
MSNKNKITSITDLKVGDTVRLRDDLEIDGDYEAGMIQEIFTRKGKDVKIWGFSCTNLPYFICNSEYPSEGSYIFLSDDIIDWDKTNGVEEEPITTRGFEFISQQQWNKSLPQDVDLEQWALLYIDLKLPKRGTKRSAGYDVFSPFTFTLEPNEDIKIPTGTKAYMLEDEQLVGHIRSSLGFKKYIRLANQTFIGDADYYNNPDNEGHWFIKIRNEGDKPITIEKGMAFAQLIFQKFLLVDGDNFTEGEDRVGGIGSTD